MNIHYICAGDYFIPRLTLSEEIHPIGRWGECTGSIGENTSWFCTTACFCPANYGHISLV